ESIRRSLEHGRQEFNIKDIFRIGKILGHLLLNRSSLLVPEFVTVEDATHPKGLDMQGHVQILGRDGKSVLGDHLLGISIELPTHGCTDGSQLASRKPGTAAKHHVFLSVGHSWETFRSLV